MTTSSIPTSTANAALRTSEELQKLGEALKNAPKVDFKPVYDPANSSVPDLYEWVLKQPKDFQAQLAAMPLDEYYKNFGTHCPHCMIDHKCMTIFRGRPNAVTKGVCIQCQHFLATGKRSTLQR